VIKRKEVCRVGEDMSNSIYFLTNFLAAESYLFIILREIE
jgi:hypothetical protein